MDNLVWGKGCEDPHGDPINLWEGGGRKRVGEILRAHPSPMQDELTLSPQKGKEATALMIIQRRLNRQDQLGSGGMNWLLVIQFVP